MTISQKIVSIIEGTLSMGGNSNNASLSNSTGIELIRTVTNNENSVKTSNGIMSVSEPLIRIGVQGGAVAAGSAFGVAPQISIPIGSVVASIVSKPLARALDVIVNKLSNLF